MVSGSTHAIIIHPADNVATALESIPAGGRIVLKNHGRVLRITAREEIPMGHKVSLFRIEKGERIIKYGETIGLATAKIDTGCHVHVHNLESRRGRGDLKERWGA